MSISDLFSMAIKSMIKRKLRTFLTILGVVIGTAAITLMMSLGVGINQQFDQLIEDMGAQALRIEVWPNWNAGPHDPLLDMNAVNRINDHPYVNIATPMPSVFLTLQTGRYQASINVIGIKPEAMALMEFYTEIGGFDLESDELQIILGANAYYQFQNERNRDPFFWSSWVEPGGARATIDLLQAPMIVSSGGGEENNNRNRPITIQPVGILASSENWQAAQNAFMRLDQFQELQDLIARQSRGANGMNNVIGWGPSGPTAPREEFSQVMVIVHNANYVSDIIEYLQESTFEAWGSTQWIDMQRESTEMLQGLLAAIAAVSLVVAAISIANTMVMSIYERTREIGIMKVIGASIHDIRQLFLIEAGLIGAIGGAAGLVFSAFVSNLMNNQGLDFFGGMMWMDTSGATTSVIPVWLYALSFGFASIIGLISGFLPARRATKISALAAIKTD